MQSPKIVPAIIHKPKFKLSTRIILAMVVVGFLSALISGAVYQIQAYDTINSNSAQAIDNFRERLLTRVESLSIAERLKQQIEESLELRKPFTGARNLVAYSLGQAIWVVVLIALGSAILAFGLGWLLTRRIVGPLERLQLASQQVAEGNFTKRVPVGSDDEVGQVSRSFNQMAAQLQASETRQRELLSDVAHELKTPLASIQGHIEALLDNLPRARANPEAIYQTVLEDVEDLDRLVGSLRTWLSTNSLISNLKPQYLNIVEELTALRERFNPRAEESGVHLETQVGKGAEFVVADRNALRHMLSNLLDNALRYTPTGGNIWLRAVAENREILFIVQDSGCGIGPEHWPHLFERFYRVDKSRTRDTGGTGLGLALVKELAEAQGGRVWVDSRLGQGSTFFIALPDKNLTHQEKW